jgi:predicted phosphohydrolase
MKIRYFSDLHLEFIRPTEINNFIGKIPPGIDEICILSGDIGNPYSSTYDTFMHFISNNFKKAFIIAGNHEYYNKRKTIQETNDLLQEYFRQFTNISFLNNNFENYENYCFVGTTLWSKITNPRYEINDVIKIPQFDYIEYNRLHMLSVDFLEEALHNNDNCVVITHHVPSHSLTDIKYKTVQMLPYNQWFSCDMDDFIERNKGKIKCWIYGHTHTPSDERLHGIQFLCNPIGYPNEHARNDFQKSVVIPDIL